MYQILFVVQALSSLFLMLMGVHFLIIHAIHRRSKSIPKALLQAHLLVSLAVMVTSLIMLCVIIFSRSYMPAFNLGRFNALLTSVLWITLQLCYACWFLFVFFKAGWFQIPLGYVAPSVALGICQTLLQAHGIHAQARQTAFMNFPQKQLLWVAQNRLVVLKISGNSNQTSVGFYSFRQYKWFMREIFPQFCRTLATLPIDPQKNKNFLNQQLAFGLLSILAGFVFLGYLLLSFIALL